MVNPLRRIIFSASSLIATGFPISSKKTSPPTAKDVACNTNWTASGILMKYLYTFSSVRVNGPPFSICFLKRGRTDPEEFRTFPNLTIEKHVFLFLFFSLKACTINSQILLDAPMTFAGLTALSVDM